MLRRQSMLWRSWTTLAKHNQVHNYLRYSHSVARRGARIAAAGPRSQRQSQRLPPLSTTSASDTLITPTAFPSNEATQSLEPTDITTVSIPPDRPNAVVTPDNKGSPILTQPALVVCRQIEMMNVFLGYEQANRYAIVDSQGNHVGFIAEEDNSMLKALSRQFLRTHRHFTATVMNAQGEVVFKIVRPYALINSRIFVYTFDDQLIGEVQQRWNLTRRRYDLFVGREQFATIDTPFLGWDFNLQDEGGATLGNVSRNFSGFGREIFTDTGEYVIRMDSADQQARGMTLDERAVSLACAVSIDFDYFSRHSSMGHGGYFPMPFFGFGGGAGEPKQDDASPNEAPPHDASPSSFPPPPTGQNDQPTSTPNEYGDVWLSDEEAGVSSPSDSGYLDALKDLWEE